MGCKGDEGWSYVTGPDKTGLDKTGLITLFCISRNTNFNIQCTVLLWWLDIEYACILRTPLYGHRYTSPVKYQLEPEVVLMRSAIESYSCSKIEKPFVYRRRFLLHYCQRHSDHRSADTVII